MPIDPLPKRLHGTGHPIAMARYNQGTKLSEKSDSGIAARMARGRGSSDVHIITPQMDLRAKSCAKSKKLNAMNVQAFRSSQLICPSAQTSHFPAFD